MDNVYSGSSPLGPDYYFQKTPYGNGVSNSLSVPGVPQPATGNTAPNSTYAGVTYNPNNSTFVFTGYFQPPTSGVYTICTYGDNVNNLYLGQGAFACGSNAVAGATPILSSTRFNTNCTNQTLVANVLYPFRQVYGELGLPNSLTTTIRLVGASSNIDAGTNFYPLSCGLAATTLTTTGPTAGTSTVPASGTVPGTVIVTSVPVGTVSTTVVGPVAGTSTVPASGTVSGTVIVTQLPGTVTSTVYGPVAGTSTVPAVGAVSGTVVITSLPAGTVTQTVNGLNRGTSTIPGNNAVSGTVIVTTCTVANPSTTVNAPTTAVVNAATNVPACATLMSFVVVGGAGGQSNLGGGRGAQIVGSIPVTQGQSVGISVGGSGTDNSTAPGLSSYGNGGAGTNGPGGGGASVLSLAGTRLVIAGAGGGGAIRITGGSGQEPMYTMGQGDAGVQGMDCYAGSGGGYTSLAEGGQPGTASGPGAGGVPRGPSNIASSGNSGSGTNGGPGKPIPTGSNPLGGGSGGGGGGYFGGGSGAVLYKTYSTNGVQTGNNWLNGGGGGGSSFISPDVQNPATTKGGNRGQIIVRFS